MLLPREEIAEELLKYTRTGRAEFPGASIERRGKAAYGGAAQSTQIVKLLEDALGTDLRAPGFPARLE